MDFDFWQNENVGWLAQLLFTQSKTRRDQIPGKTISDVFGFLTFSCSLGTFGQKRIFIGLPYSLFLKALVLLKNIEFFMIKLKTHKLNFF